MMSCYPCNIPMYVFPTSYHVPSLLSHLQHSHVLIHSKFRKVLELYGIKAMDTARGSEFNADLHEAISQLPAPSPDLKGKVIDVVEKGYMLNDKVIRYAKVVVGN